MLDSIFGTKLVQVFASDCRSNSQLRFLRCRGKTCCALCLAWGFFAVEKESDAGMRVAKDGEEGRKEVMKEFHFDVLDVYQISTSCALSPRTSRPSY